MKEIYVVKMEWNDKGWNTGDNFFTNFQDAIQHMRKCVAAQIMYLRRRGAKISHFHVWKDRVMSNIDRLDSQTITFCATNKDYTKEFYDYRVWAVRLWDNLDEIRPSHQKHEI